MTCKRCGGSGYLITADPRVDKKCYACLIKKCYDCGVIGIVLILFFLFTIAVLAAPVEEPLELPKEPASEITIFQIGECYDFNALWHWLADNDYEMISTKATGKGTYAVFEEMVESSVGQLRYYNDYIEVDLQKDINW